MGPVSIWSAGPAAPARRVAGGWQAVSRQKFAVDLDALKTDLIDPASPPTRKSLTDDDTEKIKQLNSTNQLCAVPAIIWGQIEEWGRISRKLTFNQRGIAVDRAKKIRQWGDQAPGKLTANEITTGLYTLEIVMEHAPQLVENMPDDDVNPKVASVAEQLPFELTVNIIRQAVAFDRSKKIVQDASFMLLKRIAEGSITLNNNNQDKVSRLIMTLVKQGFKPNVDL